LLSHAPSRGKTDLDDAAGWLRAAQRLAEYKTPENDAADMCPMCTAGIRVMTF